MTEQNIPTILVTQGHLMECVVPARGQRLLDLLNEPGTDFLNLQDVEIYRHSLNECISTFPDTVIRKSSILLAILTGVEHEAPERRKNAFTAKHVYDAFVTIADYEVCGQLHLKGKPDTASFLTCEANRFVPLTKASICLHGRSGEPTQERAIIVRKSAIELLQISEDVQTETDIVACIRELIDEKPQSSKPPAENEWQAV